MTRTLLLLLVGCSPTAGPHAHVTCRTGDTTIYDADVPCAVVRDGGETVIGIRGDPATGYCETLYSRTTITAPCIITPLPEAAP